MSTELMTLLSARQLAGVEAAVAQAVANAALEGAEFDEEWRDKLREVAAGVVTAEEAVAAEIARIRRV